MKLVGSERLYVFSWPPVKLLSLLATPSVYEAFPNHFACEARLLHHALSMMERKVAPRLRPLSLSFLHASEWTINIALGAVMAD
jgi:hypothetical protein